MSISGEEKNEAIETSLKDEGKKDDEDRILEMPEPADLPKGELPETPTTETPTALSPSGKKKKVKILDEEHVTFAKLDMAEELEEIIKNQPAILNRQCAEGNTLLIWAAIEQNLKTFEMLLEHEDCDVNIRGAGGNTALLRCALVGYPIHLDMATILINEENDRCDISIRNDRDETAYTVAAKFCRYEMASQFTGWKIEP